jgi:putative ABC transport system permease protein
MTARRVGIARQNLLADRRRLAAGVIGIALALMLVLLLGGLWQGIQRQASAYPDRVGADLYVAQRGVQDFLGETSSIPRSTVRTVRATPGVQWAAPVRGQFVVFELHGKKVAAFVVGYVPGRQGGPWALSSGRAPHRPEDVVVDRALARRHGITVGDRLSVGGSIFRIVGLARASAVMTGFVFMTHDATDTLFRSPETTSFVLVGASHPRTVAARLRAQGLFVLTKEQIAGNDRRLFIGILGSPLRLMVAVSFVAGALVVALTVYAAVIERRREYGIVKAIGASGWTVAGIVLRQSFVLSAVGLVLGFGLFLAGRALIAELRPQFSVVVTPASVLLAVVAALAMAGIAAIVPARRLAREEPAIVYREQ